MNGATLPATAIRQQADPEEIPDRPGAGSPPFPVEFLGWLPAFLSSGNCGAHPQFAHTLHPPPGYCFTQSRPHHLQSELGPWARAMVWLLHAIGLVLQRTLGFHRYCKAFGMIHCLSTVWLFVHSLVRLTLNTGRPAKSFLFLRSRHFQSQLMAPRRSELVFLTSVPFTYGRNPWLIEIEDPTTLFHPFIVNGQTWEIDVARSPYFGMVKDLLEADACRGIITHMRSTAQALPRLFQSEKISRKVSYAPLGVPLPRLVRKRDDDTINLLFTNSWHQLPVGFFLRGGLDVLEAFEILRERYPQVRLTVRSSIPPLEERYHRILEKGWARVIHRFTPKETLEEIQRETDIYLLPAARIHIVSVLQAMSFGQAVVVSDGWGMEEYVTDEVTGLVIPGRAGKVSHMDPETGMLREDYRPMYSSDRGAVDGLVQAVSRLIEDRDLRRRLGRAARRDVEERFSIENWNLGLQAAFDKARWIRPQ